MADINSVTLVGRLVRDCELKYTTAGQAIGRFSIAVNRAKRTADGRWEEEPNFFDCVYFGKAAESVSQYLTKGRQVAIQGELRQSRWESNEGQRSRVEIAVLNLSLGQGSTSTQRGVMPQQAPMQQGMRDNGYSRTSQQGYGASGVSNIAPSGGPEDFQDDSIPF